MRQLKEKTKEKQRKQKDENMENRCMYKKIFTEMHAYSKHMVVIESATSVKQCVSVLMTLALRICSPSFH